MKKWMLMALALMTLPACSNVQEDLRSPCVGADGSPCVRRPVNTDIDQG